MSGAGQRSAEWIYGGIWLLLVQCFRVPDGPPKLPSDMTGTLQVFHPSRRFLSYLKAYFWVALVLIDVAILVGWLAIYWNYPIAGLILAIPALLIAVVPDIVAYIAIHLRYDTIWYGVSCRGLYVRRGIVVITEHTITLENLQNVTLRQGPIEQLFSIATLVVETAGASAGEGDDIFSVGNRTIIVGLDNADEIRKMLMQRVRSLPAAGLGDDTAGLGDDTDRSHSSGWAPTDLQLLTEIRDEIKRYR
jgi:membrane protein YdbS with pleckstrin-like domain